IAHLPFLQGLGLNLRVLGLSAGIAMVIAVLLAITPAIKLSFQKMSDGLTEASRGSSGTAWSRLGSKLAPVELAISIVLVVGAGLLGQSLYRLLHVYVGFQPDHVATILAIAPQASYGKDEQAARLQQRILDTISRLPGVKSASATSRLPVTGNGDTTWVRFVGRPYNGEHNEVNARDVSSDYFATLG